MTRRVVMWFRRDLRLDDNPAWAAATSSSEHVVALFVIDPVLMASAGPHRQTQLLAHLAALDEQLQRQGGRLYVRTGPPVPLVTMLVKELDAHAVYANADVTPYARRRDGDVRDHLDVPFRQFWGGLVHPPGSLPTSSGRTSRVFTPFAKKWFQAEPLAWPISGSVVVEDKAGDGLPDLKDRPFQSGGQEAAMDRLLTFSEKVDSYESSRDVPGIDGTSMLSADLRFGTLSPRTILSVIGTSTAGRTAFVRQLAWRDWFAHLLWEVPTLVDTPLKSDLNQLVWQNDPDDIAAWKTGNTGYPIVDAGMRQLATTGWMHNRVRMIAASFLVKDLLADWRIGERWFRRLLVDADVAQNAGNWQWVAGTGPDAAPYFRVFNPVLQSQKFDSSGAYIRRYVPELAGVDSSAIHSPWSVPPMELASQGVVLGEEYPYPIVDHAWARDRALAAYGQARTLAGPNKSSGSASGEHQFDHGAQTGHDQRERHDEGRDLDHP